MKTIASALLSLFFCGSLVAQEQPAAERCYQEGDVDAFLSTQRLAKRRSIVLFNFDDDSG